jgi:hypothetical protein
MLILLVVLFVSLDSLATEQFSFLHRGYVLTASLTHILLFKLWKSNFILTDAELHSPVGTVTILRSERAIMVFFFKAPRPASGLTQTVVDRYRRLFSS